MVKRMDADGVVNSTSLLNNHSNVSNTASLLSSEGEKDSQGTTPSGGSTRREKTSSKKTWRDLSPSKKLTFTSDSCSSVEGSPTKCRSFSSDGSGKNKITWKDVSPSKTSLEKSLSGGDCRSSSSCTCHKEVSNQSNSMTKSPRRSLSGNNNTGMTQTDSVSSSSPTRTASPDECSTNDYFYDEDFIVQFDTNIRDSLMEACECEHGKSGSVGFPHVLTGSYKRFKNYLRENVREHMESELSSSQNSMEVSTSEREMMCSSDLLEFDSEPLFSSCGQAETCRHNHQSTDSLDRHLKCHAQGQDLSCSKTSEGKLHVDCCPRKDEYFLSFDGSHGRDSASEFSFTTHDSEENNVADIQSDFSTDCEGDDVCSDSFHFCKGHKDDSDVHRGVKRLHKKLATLPEDSTESCESLDDAKSLQRRPSPKRSPTRSRNMEAKLKHISPNKTVESNLRHCCNERNTGIGTCSSKKKSVISWKHVKNLRKLGLLDNILDPSRSSSLPNLNIHSWHSMHGEKHQQCIAESVDSFPLKRHSSSLLDLYQRLKNQSNPVSPETLENIETLLFNKGGYSDYSTTSSEDKDGSLCKLCCKTGVYSGYNCKQYKHSVHTADRPNSLNVLHEHCCHGTSLPKGFCCRTMVSKETAISPARVTTFLGTKNFSAQFPPATHDCAIQTSVNKDNAPYDNKQQQTSPTLCAKQEILSLVDKNLDCNEFVKQKNGHSSVQELVHDKCCTSVPHRSRSYHGTGSSRRCSVSPPRRMGQSAFYTHRSLPDLSFLGCPFSSDSECERSLFDPVQIPIIYTPDIPADCHSCQCGKKGMRSSSVPSFPNTDSSSTGKPKKPPRRSKSACSCTLHGVQSCRQCEFVSSSSGFSTSSTSSGIDPGYSDSKSRSLSCDLERLIYLPPHVQVVTSNGSNEKRKDSKSVNCNLTERRFEKYTNEIHPGAMKLRQNSLGHTDGDTDPEDFLYSLREESSTASSSSDTQSIDLGRHTCKKAFWETQRPGHIDLDCMTDEDYSSMPIPEIKMSDEHRPLKSCLRKNGNQFRSRSMSEGLLDGGLKTITERKKENRHSCACDQYEILSDDKQAEFMNLLAAQNKAKVEETLAEQPEEELEEEEEEEVDTGSDRDDKQGKRKSVSFATEISFHSPVYSPQASPKHPDELTGDHAPSQEHTLTQKFVGLFKQERRTETSPPSVCSDDSGTEGPPQDFVNSSPEFSDLDESQNTLTHKSDLLRNLARSAENLVAHFAQTSQPFDKLRLGNSSETPELGDLILSEFCPALAQVIGDGLKPYLAGLSVFGKIQLSPWRVAEGSADLGPYTRAVHELVDQLKDQFLHYTNTQKFYAFIFGLLNLRLVDFWMGYIRHKENVTKFYNSNSVLLMSNDKLCHAYENMLLTLQPLATLPFQVEYDVISQFSANSSKGYLKPDIESLEFSSPTDKPCLNRSNSFGEEASKALNWFGHSTIPKAKSFVSSASHKVSPSLSKLQDSAKKSFDFIGRMSSKTESDSSFDSERELRGEECLSDQKINLNSCAKSSDDAISADAEDSTDEEKTSRKSAGSPSSLKQPSKIPTFAQRLFPAGSSEKGTYKQTDYSFDEESKDSSQEESSQPTKPDSLQLKDGAQAQAQNSGSPSKIIQFFDKLLLPKSSTNTTSPKGANRWSWTGGQTGQTGIPSLKSKKNDLHRSLPGNLKGMESKAKPKSFHSDSSLSSHVNNVHAHKLTKIEEDGERTTAENTACQAKSSLTPIAIKIPGAHKMVVPQNRLKTFSVKSPRQSSPEKTLRSLSPEKPPRAHSVDKTVMNSSIERQGGKSRSPEKRSRIPRLNHKSKSASDTVDENSNPKPSKASPNKKRENQDKKEQLVGKVYQSDKKEIVVVKDCSSNDCFQKPEYGYVKTIVSLESEADGCLKVGKDEYLEVLAQLDSEWLFCAHGKTEGMVRFKNVTRVTNREEFESLHSDFYA